MPLLIEKLVFDIQGSLRKFCRTSLILIRSQNNFKHLIVMRAYAKSTGQKYLATSRFGDINDNFIM